MRGVLVIVSGFSGAGKGTVMKRLMEKYDSYSLSISATTRKPRDGEEDGREYFFKTVGQFEDMIEKGQLIEYAKYVGNYYGTPKEYVEKQLDEGRNVRFTLSALIILISADFDSQIFRSFPLRFFRLIPNCFQGIRKLTHFRLLT